jgi:oxygen-independent coproporphyrinogen-3 oxidase
MADRYLSALESEISGHRWSWRPETLYLGGGSPGELACTALRRLLAATPGNPWREATIEAPPGCISPEKAACWRDSGLNRVSIGVQSFVSRELAKTGRRHSAAAVEAEIRVLRAAGLDNINIDLIAGLPGQTPQTWLESLQWIERLQVPHVSVYMLEVDEDSRLGREILSGGARYGAPETPSADVCAELYEAAVERLRAMGIRRYEISNFARPGFESLHNLTYWRLQPYAAFGADAHSFDGSVRSRNAESPAEYVARWESGKEARIEAVPARLDEERFFVGLRLSEGIMPSPEERRVHDAAIRRLAGAGLVETEGGVLRLTGRGVLLSNEVFQEFISS